MLRSVANQGYAFRRQSDLVPARFQVLGERCSGTNYLDKVLRANTVLKPTTVQDWKHGFPQFLGVPHRTVLVVCVRNAMDWARSLHAKPWHAAPHVQALPFDAFLTAPWDSRLDRRRYFANPGIATMIGAPLQPDRHPITGQMFPSIFAMRAAKLAAWMGLASRECNLVILRYEAVAADPDGFVAAFCEAFDLDAPEALTLPSRRLGSRFRPAIAERPATPRKLSDAQRDTIRGQLDHAQENDLGYFY